MDHAIGGNDIGAGDGCSSTVASPFNFCSTSQRYRHISSLKRCGSCPFGQIAGKNPCIKNMVEQNIFNGVRICRLDRGNGRKPRIYERLIGRRKNSERTGSRQGRSNIGSAGSRALNTRAEQQAPGRLSCCWQQQFLQCYHSAASIHCQ